MSIGWCMNDAVTHIPYKGYCLNDVIWCQPYMAYMLPMRSFITNIKCNTMTYIQYCISTSQIQQYDIIWNQIVISIILDLANQQGIFHDVNWATAKQSLHLMCLRDHVPCTSTVNAAINQKVVIHLISSL